MQRGYSDNCKYVLVRTVGQTTQDYPVTLTGSLNCQPLTAVFIYGTSSGTDTCLLTFGNTGINTVSGEASLISVYPNPANQVIRFTASDAMTGSAYLIYDQMGKVVMSGILNALSTDIHLSNLSGGIYILSIEGPLKQTVKVIKY